MKRVAGMVAACGLAVCACGDVVIENDRLRLTVGDDAVVKSLTVKPSGEECVDATEGLPLFSVTQDRPFNNEIKLAHPNKRTTYACNRLRAEQHFCSCKSVFSLRHFYHRRNYTIKQEAKPFLRVKAARRVATRRF